VEFTYSVASSVEAAAYASATWRQDSMNGSHVSSVSQPGAV
jgi:hypothetical protein